MTTNFKNTCKNVMNLAWQFVKKNGMSMSDALVMAWKNIKMKAEMKHRIVRFWFQKVDGSVREAYGTLIDTMLPPTKGTGNASTTTQCYYDTEKEAYRCFKKANLINFV